MYRLAAIQTILVLIVHGQWLEWEKDTMSLCSNETCHRTVQMIRHCIIRKRACTGPRLKNFTEKCSVSQCERDRRVHHTGGWGPWYENFVVPCTVTCGEGNGSLYILTKRDCYSVSVCDGESVNIARESCVAPLRVCPVRSTQIKTIDLSTNETLILLSTFLITLLLIVCFVHYRLTHRDDSGESKRLVVDFKEMNTFRIQPNEAESFDNNYDGATSNNANSNVHASNSFQLTDVANQPHVCTVSDSNIFTFRNDVIEGFRNDVDENLDFRSQAITSKTFRNENGTGQEFRNKMAAGQEFRNKMAAGQEFRNKMAAGQEFRNKMAAGQEFRNKMAAGQEFRNKMAAGQEFRNKMAAGQEFRNKMAAGQEFRKEVTAEEKIREEIVSVFRNEIMMDYDYDSGRSLSRASHIGTSVGFHTAFLHDGHADNDNSHNNNVVLSSRQSSVFSRQQGFDVTFSENTSEQKW